MVSLAKIVRGGVLGLAALAAVGVGSAFAESIPEKTVTRDLVRRVLVDGCVYAQHARAAQAGEKTNRTDFVEPCQCAANRFIKGVADKDIAELQGQPQVPDAWARSVDAGTAECRR